MAMTVVDKDCTEKAEDFTYHLVNMGYTKGMKDGYAKAIEEFAVALKEKCKEKMDVFGFGTLDVWEINKIAKELKGE
jgi:hypothetical protein